MTEGEGGVHKATKFPTPHVVHNIPTRTDLDVFYMQMAFILVIWPESRSDEGPGLIMTMGTSHRSARNDILRHCSCHTTLDIHHQVWGRLQIRR